MLLLSIGENIEFREIVYGPPDIVPTRYSEETKMDMGVKFESEQKGSCGLAYYAMGLSPQILAQH
jgi:hypothetical protein